MQELVFFLIAIVFYAAVVMMYNWASPCKLFGHDLYDITEDQGSVVMAQCADCDEIIIYD